MHFSKKRILLRKYNKQFLLKVILLKTYFFQKMARITKILKLINTLKIVLLIKLMFEKLFNNI